MGGIPLLLLHRLVAPAGYGPSDRRRLFVVRKSYQEIIRVCTAAKAYSQSAGYSGSEYAGSDHWPESESLFCRHRNWLWPVLRQRKLDRRG